MSDLDSQEVRRLGQGVREVTAMALPPELRRLLREHVTRIVRYAVSQGLLFQDPNPRTARTVGLYRDLKACQATATWLEEHSASEEAKADYCQIARLLVRVVTLIDGTVFTVIDGKPVAGSGCGQAS